MKLELGTCANLSKKIIQLAIKNIYKFLFIYPNVGPKLQLKKLIVVLISRSENTFYRTKHVNEFCTDPSIESGFWIFLVQRTASNGLLKPPFLFMYCLYFLLTTKCTAPCSLPLTWIDETDVFSVNCQILFTSNFQHPLHIIRKLLLYF